MHACTAGECLTVGRRSGLGWEDQEWGSMREIRIQEVCLGWRGGQRTSPTSDPSLTRMRRAICALTTHEPPTSGMVVGTVNSLYCVPEPPPRPARSPASSKNLDHVRRGPRTLLLLLLLSIKRFLLDPWIHEGIKAGAGAPEGTSKPVQTQCNAFPPTNPNNPKAGCREKRRAKTKSAARSAQHQPLAQCCGNLRATMPPC